MKVDPKITWIANCTNIERDRRRKYHYEKEFTYDSCRDVSSQLVGIDSYQVTRVDFETKLVFGNEQTEKLFNKKVKKFKKKYKRRHGNISFTQNVILKGLQKNILSVTKGAELPGGMSSFIYWICALLTGVIFYRCWFNSVTGDFDYYFVKEISREIVKRKESSSSND